MSERYAKVAVEFSKDTLNGKVLRDGERVIVRWPDGTSSNTVVKVTSEPTDAESVVTDDDGIIHRILHRTTERASVDIAHRGVQLKVALRDSELFLVRDLPQ